MATLQVVDIADLVTTTQADLGRMRWTEAATDLQEFVAFGSLINKGRITFGSGSSVTWNVRVGHLPAGNARHTGMHNVDVTNVGEGMKTANAPWKFAETSYLFDRRELAMNKDPARIVDLVATRRVEAMVQLAEEIEDKFWAENPGVTSDHPLGIKTWFVRNSTAAFGFNGGNPDNYSGGVGGLNSTTYPRWANGTARYVTVNKGDLIAKWREAFVKTKFKSPVAVSQYNTGDRYAFYTNYSVISTLEEVLESQNESLGTDVASMDGNTVMRKIPITWVPQLDSDATNPIYGMNWGVFKVAMLNGWDLKESGPTEHGLAHNTVTTHIDLVYQLICYDRRRIFVLDIA